MMKTIAYIAVLMALAVSAFAGQICETIALGFLLVAIQLEFLHKE